MLARKRRSPEIFVADIAAYRLIDNVTKRTKINCVVPNSRKLAHENRKILEMDKLFFPSKMGLRVEYRVPRNVTCLVVVRGRLELKPGACENSLA
jgi:hypothetical protein